jgi:hypothetical protein
MLPNQVNDITLGSVAKIVHQAIKAYAESTGDRSINDWQFTSAPDRSKLVRSVAFRIDYPDLHSRDIHQNWIRMRMDDGWTHGEYDSDYKTHPLLVEYTQLDPVTKIKNSLLCAIVDALIQNAL